MIDLAKLWNRFRGENLLTVIPNKSSNDVYAVYTDYMTDHRGVYTAVIGCKVNSLDSIPPGLIGREFNGGQYRKFTAKGKMPHVVIRQWQEIWNEEGEADYAGEKANLPPAFPLAHSVREAAHAARGCDLRHHGEARDHDVDRVAQR